MLEQISLSSFSTCGARGSGQAGRLTAKGSRAAIGPGPRVNGALRQLPAPHRPRPGPHHFAVLLDALDVLLVALALLLLLDGRDDPPGRPPGANHVLVGHRKQVPLLHGQLLVVHHLRHLFHLLNLRARAQRTRCQHPTRRAKYGATASAAPPIRPAATASHAERDRAMPQRNPRGRPRAARRSRTRLPTRQLKPELQRTISSYRSACSASLAMYTHSSLSTGPSMVAEQSWPWGGCPGSPGMPAQSRQSRRSQPTARRGDED